MAAYFIPKIFEVSEWRVDLNQENAVNIFLGMSLLYIFAAITGRVLTDMREAEVKRSKVLQTLVESKTIELQRNLDDLKRAQVQLIQSEKMASLGLLTAGIAHEINNPINFISVGISALERKLNQLNEQAQSNSADQLETQKKITQLISDIKIGTSRTEEIVSSLRTFSQTDKAELKVASINEGIESTLVLLNSRLKGRIEVVKHLEENLPPILCYPGKLNQVFMNLLTNAIDAIAGKGTITISSRSVNKHVEISITDTGCGMPKKVQEKIFEPFFTTKDVGLGTGLGLSISYGIIGQHRGSITVSSEEGKGSTFTMRLPIK
jgi:signal transduction histidine kinase